MSPEEARVRQIAQDFLIGHRQASRVEVEDEIRRQFGPLSRADWWRVNEAIDIVLKDFRQMKNFQSAVLVALMLWCSVASANTLDEIMPASGPGGPTHVAVQSGRWDDTATWSNGVIPTPAARIFIPAGIDVTRHVDAFPLWIRVEGTLRACLYCPTTLGVHTVLVLPGGYFEMGTEATPCTGLTALEFIAKEFLPGDDSRLSCGLIAEGGKISVHGKPKTHMSILAAEVPAGAVELTLTEAPSGWELGDEIVIAGTDSLLFVNGNEVRETYQTEKSRIIGLNGATIKFDRPTKYRHFPWAPDLQVHVVNLTRNVSIRSQVAPIASGGLAFGGNQENLRGHIMVMPGMNGVPGPPSVICAAEERELGRTDKRRIATDPRKTEYGGIVPGSQDNPRGRYGDHTHKCGPLNAPHKRKWVVVRGSVGWGMVNHASHCEWDDCVATECFGAGFVTEEGQEYGYMRRCASFLNRGQGDYIVSTDADHGDALAADWGKDGSGFWLQGGLMEVSDCVAFDNSGRGFALFNRTMNGYPAYNQLMPEHLRFKIIVDQSFLTPDYATLVHGDSPHAPSSAVPQRVFKNNTAYGNKVGVQCWSGPTHNASSRQIWPITARGEIENLTLWGRGALLHLEYMRQVDIDGLTIVGDKWRGEWNHIMPFAPIHLRSPHITIRNVEIDGFTRDHAYPLPVPISTDDNNGGEGPKWKIQGNYPVSNRNGAIITLQQP